ncbi:unnamed protein product [Fraxinus pennsylvanica]|uniref:DUF4704 domain-containing protein n=1 Tax=Fraxinus pennsylvanica TaxID=56036 RepID=A0AAD1Z9R8_9LAMI|nr:unnamed protein product [Fraxinus pennsylvanica]
MEEEEEIRDHRGFSGGNSETCGEGNGVDHIVGTSITEKVEIHSNIADNEGTNVVLEGVDSSSPVVDDDLFEHVPLKEHNKNAEDVNESLIPDNLRHSSGGSEETFEFSFGNVPSSGFNSPLGAEMLHDHHFSSPGHERDLTDNITVSSSSASLDSALYFRVDSGFSPVESPQKTKPKQVMLNVSPELLHLVDSAIMGKTESLEKLKNIVSGVEIFGNGEEAVNIAYLVVDSLLATMGDMVFTESSVMRDANAIQTLLDGCRRCYWSIRESDSVNTFSINEDARLVGEVNALIDELLVVVELLVVAAPPSLAVEDVQCLLGFMVDCPQPNQVVRVLHLIYRLVVQPNTSRAQTFAEAFISSGGIETLLVLLQREANAGDIDAPNFSSSKRDEALSSQKTEVDIGDRTSEDIGCDYTGPMDKNDLTSQEKAYESKSFDGSTISNIQRMSSIHENPFIKNLGGISFSLSAENARNNVYNIDKSDGIIVGIINLLSALVISGYLKFDKPVPPDVTNNILGLIEGGGTMFDDKVSLLLFGLQKAFEAAPNRLMTSNVYTALLAASINMSSTDEGLYLYDSRHRFEHLQLLLVLLRSLSYASSALQSRALQDLLILACSHPENRSSLTKMDEWPEWILEILISNHEKSGSKNTNSSRTRDVEDFIHNFLIIMLEHSMRQKDGWKVRLF